MQLFKDNEFPQVLFKAGFPDGKHVTSKKDLQAAEAEGWQRSYVPHEYPKFVGPHDVVTYETVKDENGRGSYVEERRENRGGKVVQNAQEEKEHLDLLASKAEKPKAEKPKAA